MTRVEGIVYAPGEEYDRREGTFSMGLFRVRTSKAKIDGQVISRSIQDEYRL